MLRNRSIAAKLALFILAGNLAVFLAVLAASYYYSRAAILKNIEENARNLVFRTVNQMDAVLGGVQKIPRTLAPFLSNPDLSRKGLDAILSRAVEENKEVFGMAAAFEPFAFDPAARYFAPYCYKKDGAIAFRALGGPDDQYFFDSWYQVAKECGRPSWTEPYFDEGGGEILMTTYSVPFYRKKAFLGILSADVSLQWLQKLVSDIRFHETGYAFLISENGTFIVSPRRDFVMNESIFSVAEASGDTALRETGKKMILGGAGFVPMKSIHSGKDGFLCYAPLSSSGWSMGVFFPSDELFEDINQLHRVILIFAVCGTLLIAGVIVLISKRLTRPLVFLSEAAQKIGSGDLDTAIPAFRSLDEAGRLARSFEAMRDALKAYIQRLTETTAAKERIQSELSIAHEIQMGILPKIFPPFPDRREFDIFAVIDPAREVGGDLYDFYLLDPDHLFFVIGDVSGKGVPASLFMAVTTTLFKVTAKTGAAPDAILANINETLAKDNDTAMFVTVFCGILNIRTGEISFANGGHNAPVLIRADGDLSPLPRIGGMLLGAMENATYSMGQITLAPGDKLFLYTDGVTEAMDPEKHLFSEKRMMLALVELQSSSVREIVEGMRQKLKDFASGAPQADDITMLVIEFSGDTASVRPGERAAR